MKRVIRKRRSAQILQYPHVRLVTNDDLILQQEAETLFRELKGRCPVCWCTDDGSGKQDGCLSIQARHGKLTFGCRACNANHESIAAKLVRQKPLKGKRKVTTARSAERA